MRVAEAIRQKLSGGLTPSKLEIADESSLHKGHVGARPEGETHFRVLIVSPVFRGMGRVQRQREVYRLLREELATDIHALALRTLTPEEDEQGEKTRDEYTE